MAVDTSIYNALLRPPKSVAEYDAEALAGQQNKLSLQMGQAKMAEYQRGVDDEQALRGVVGQFGADKTANYKKLLGSGRLKEAQAYEKANLETAKSQREAEKEQFALAKDRLALLNNAIAGSVDQNSYTMNRQMLASQNVDVSQIPEQFDPAYLANAKQQALTEAQRVEQLWKEKGFDQEERKFSYQQTNDLATRLLTKRGQDTTASTASKRLAFDKEQAVGTGPDASEAMIDAIGQGKMAPPSGYALRNPKMLQMMERVAQKYPDFDATEYDGKKRAMRDFTTGRQGDSIRSFAVASDHLKQLDSLVDALNNGNTPLVNKYANIIATQTGSTAPTNFEAAKGIVAKEVLKSIVAGGGGVEERQELSHLLADAKTGPQLKGVIKTYLHLMEAQKEGLERQYEVSTGRKDAKTRFDYSKKPGGHDGAAPSEAKFLGFE